MIVRLVVDMCMWYRRVVRAGLGTRIGLQVCRVQIGCDRVHGTSCHWCNDCWWRHSLLLLGAHTLLHLRASGTFPILNSYLNEGEANFCRKWFEPSRYVREAGLAFDRVLDLQEDRRGVPPFRSCAAGKDVWPMTYSL